MSKDETIRTLAYKVQELSEALLNATEDFDDPYTTEEFDEDQKLAADAIKSAS